MPTALTRRSDQMIHKRISAKPAVDPKYCAVVAELECQSLDPRKRARTESYLVPYGSALFDSGIRPDVTGSQDLDEARGMFCAAQESAIFTVRQTLRLMP